MNLNFLKQYPAMSAAITDVILIVLGYFGLNITPDQLVAVISAITILFGALVHSNVTPLAKSDKAAEVK